jgi:hypothetical protein
MKEGNLKGRQELKERNERRRCELNGRRKKGKE